MRGRLQSPFRTLAAAVVISAILATPALAGTDATYAALRAAAPDGRTVPVSGLVLERDVFRFQLDSGTIHFLAPVEGRTVGAVFVGQGSYRLSPGDASRAPAARARLWRRPGLRDPLRPLRRLVLLFTDGTAEEIGKHAAAQAGAPDRQAIQAWIEHMNRQRKDFRTNFHLRLLDDLLNRSETLGTPDGVFLAFVDGERHPPALAAVDPAGAEALRLAIAGRRRGVGLLRRGRAQGGLLVPLRPGARTPAGVRPPGASPTPSTTGSRRAWRATPTSPARPRCA